MGDSEFWVEVLDCLATFNFSSGWQAVGDGETGGNGLKGWRMVGEAGVGHSIS